MSLSFRGVCYCVLWYSSILFGCYFLYAPLLPLLLLHRPLYRKITDAIYVLWEAFNVSLLELLFNVRFVVTGDRIVPTESSLFVCNHRTRVDWNFVWPAVFHAETTTTAHNMKLVLKENIKTIPGLGWVMQMCRFLYISRKWQEDERKMSSLVDHLSAEQRPFQLLLFPEGTNLTKQTKSKSDKFANDNNLKPYKFVLHPRTTGFSFLAERMRGGKALDSVYDMTIGYPDEMPLDERDLWEGKFPKFIHFHIKRHNAQDIPTTLIGLEKWLQEVWKEKEALLANFYQENTPFPAANADQIRPQKPVPIQYLSLVAWIYFLYWIIYNLVFSWLGAGWILMVTAFMVVVSRYTGGLQSIEVTLERQGILGLIWKRKQE